MQHDAQQLINLLAVEIEQLKAGGEIEEAIERATRLVELSREQNVASADMANALRALVTLYEESGDYRGAISLYHQLRDLQRAALGEYHPAVATISHDLAFMYDIESEYETAQVFYLEALDLQRQVLDGDHPDLARTLNNLGTLYNGLGDYAAAQPLHEEALAIRRNVYGDHHPETAMSLVNLAAVCKAASDYSRAEALYKEAIEIERGATGGHRHPEYYAADINSLATLYYTQGRYEEAEQLYKSSLELRREIFGYRDLSVAQSLANLQATYEAMGKYAEAIRVGEEALEIRRELLGEEDAVVAQTLNNLTSIYESVGDYAKAMSYCREALSIYRQQIGSEHSDYARNLNNLAWLRQQMGDYGAAERLYEQALDILRADPSPEDPDFATGLHNLGLLYHTTERYDQAEALLLQALEIRRATLGKRHPDVGTNLTNLANVYRSQGKFPEAEQLYEEAASIDREALGDGHPLYATDLNNLGLLYCDMGRYLEAEPLLRKAAHIWRSTSRGDHLDLASALDNLAGVLVAIGRAVEAFTLLEEAAAIEERLVDQLFNVGSERQRLASLQTLQSTMSSFISLAMRHDAAPDRVPSGALDRCFALVLRRKGLGAEAFAAERDAVLGGRHPALQPQLIELTALRRMIAQRTLGGPGERNPDRHRGELAEWAAQRDALESALASQIPEMRVIKRPDMADLNLSALASRLGRGAALLEVVLLTPRDFEAVPAQNEARWSAPRYIAFVLHATATPEYSLQAVDLGEARTLDSLVDSFRLAVGSEESAGTPVRAVREEQVTGRDPGMSAYLSAGSALRRALFDALRPSIGECTRLFIAPDGEIARVPFECLPVDSRHHLIDEFQISYLTSGRDLLRQSVLSASQPGAPVVAADPDFNLGRLGGGKGMSAPGVAGTLRETRHSMFGPLHFAQLPGSRVEGEEVAALLEVDLLAGGAANKSRLKSCRSPMILHLATHGFFLSKPEYQPALDPRFAAAHGSGSGSETVLLEMVNPLLRSGLALSGANTWLDGGTPPPEAEEGLITAEEITGMDLLETRLVVLSACDTGLGHVQAGEGVFGLGRAFILAGARSLILSLWRVPDRQTAELMRRFYAALLGGDEGEGMGPAEALRAAQLALKESYPHPLYWGGFICVWNPGPLRNRPTA